MSRFFCETWENATRPMVQLVPFRLALVSSRAGPHFSQKKREVEHPGTHTHAPTPNAAMHPSACGITENRRLLVTDVGDSLGLVSPHAREAAPLLWRQRSAFRDVQLLEAPAVF